MKRRFITLAISATLLAGLTVAPAHAAYYKVNVCDVEVTSVNPGNGKVTSAIENGTYSFTGTTLPEGDYVGDCAGYGIITKSGKRNGHKK